MNTDVYVRLREQLNQYSVGYPTTESGVELRILERLFTEEQAALCLQLSLMLEAAESVAARVERSVDEVAAQLEEMAQRGLIFRHRKGGATRYCAAPFVIGIYEYQLQHMDRELAQMFDDYFEEAFLDTVAHLVSPLRTIPVNKSFDVKWPIAPYEDARQIIASQTTVAVANCICRVQKELVETPCDRPQEVCLLFGSHGKFYVDNGMARFISQEEALAILDRSEEAGLVHQPFNAKAVGGMCNCCGDCCAGLRALKRQPRPVDCTITNYFARSDADVCSGCGTCQDRCQMDAIAIGPDDVALVERVRCIGCGLCVTTCPTEAMRLERVDQAEQRLPPDTGKETMTEMASARGTSLFPLAMSKK